MAVRASVKSSSAFAAGAKQHVIKNISMSNGAIVFLAFIPLSSLEVISRDWGLLSYRI
jgi:hypothetical protein